MKEITTVAVLMLMLLQSKAQSVSVNYIKEFVSDSKSFFTDKNFAPYAVSGISITYSQALKKLPLTVNASAVSRTRKPPPRYIKYPDPFVLFGYAIDNKIEADSASFSNSNSRSVDVLAGLGFIVPHKENSKFLVTVNADFGVAFNNNQSVDYFFQKKLTGKAEVKKTQFVFNPSVQAKYFFTNNIGINITAGYNNRGGVNAGIGLEARLGHRCLICGGWHWRKGCPNAHPRPRPRR
jgi:hypothetical protein